MKETDAIPFLFTRLMCLWITVKSLFFWSSSSFKWWWKVPSCCKEVSEANVHWLHHLLKLWWCLERKQYLYRKAKVLTYSLSLSFNCLLFPYSGHISLLLSDSLSDPTFWGPSSLSMMLSRRILELRLPEPVQPDFSVWNKWARESHLATIL